MTTTYTAGLRLAVPAAGELSGTWGDVVNNNIVAMIEQAITGIATIAMADANQTLTTVNGASDESRCIIIKCTGALTAQRNVVVPAVGKMYVVVNSTTGGFGIQVKTTGTGVVVPASSNGLVVCDGTNVVLAMNYMTGYALLASPAFTGSPTAPTQAIDDNSTKLSTTEYVDRASYIATVSPFLRSTLSQLNYILNGGL